MANNVKEEDIRPKKLFDQLLNLSEEDVNTFFIDVPRYHCDCPGCGSDNNKVTFEKNNFTYCTCQQCYSLFVNPRPPKDVFNRFYTDGTSAKFFAEKFLPSVIETRRKKIFIPRIKQVHEIAASKNITPKVIIEVGAGHGIFLEEWRKVSPNTERKAIEPNPIMAQRCRELGIDVLEKTSEEADEWSNIGDIVVSFEVLEHVTNSLEFVTSLLKFTRPGGLVIATGLCGDGFDIKVLGVKSKSITPPHHINFCSVEGYELLFLRAGFGNIDIRTPGKLDVEIVAKTLMDDTINLSNFEKLLLSKRPEILENFQEFLSNNQLSSHCWITAQKPLL